MTAPAGPLGPTDAVLVERVLAADREAFATVYDRYGAKLFDFAYAMLRHREDAADAVADSFVLFAERLPQLRDPERLRPWLYAIVRSECLRRLKARKRIAYGDDEQLIDMADDAITPEQSAEQSALRQLVWDAAAGLADRDRGLLDLHLRQGLEGAELGEAMGTTAANAYVMLNRLRAQVDRSLGALLISRLGRDDCVELGKVLGDWDGSFSVLVRKRVARHIEGCPVCAALRSKSVSPWTLLAAVPAFPAPLLLRDRVLRDTELVAWSGPAAGGGASGTAPAGRDAPDEGGDDRGGAWWSERRVLGIAALLGLLLILGGVTRWAVADDPGPTPAPASAGPEVGETSTLLLPKPSAIPSPKPTLSPTRSASATPAPGSLTLSTRSIDLGRRATTATVVVSNTGEAALDFTAVSRDGWLTVSPTAGKLDGGESAALTLRATRSGLPEGRSTGTVVVSGAGTALALAVTATQEQPPVVGAPATGRAPSCQVPVTASVTDESTLTSVTLHWSGPSGAGQVAMTGSGSQWSAEISPVNVGGDITMYVVARDARGNSATGPSRTVYVNPCPG